MQWARASRRALSNESRHTWRGEVALQFLVPRLAFLGEARLLLKHRSEHGAEWLDVAAAAMDASGVATPCVCAVDVCAGASQRGAWPRSSARAGADLVVQGANLANVSGLARPAVNPRPALCGAHS